MFAVSKCIASLLQPRLVYYCSVSSYHSKRTVSSTYAPPVPDAIIGTAVTKDESRDFMALFPDIVRDLTTYDKQLDINLPEVTKWYTKVLQYNVPNGKKNRGLLLVSAYKLMSSDLNAENIRMAQIMGWCVELMQAFFLVFDDIMDSSETRRGRQCWYRNDDVGLMAINDAILLEQGIYLVMKKHFKDKSYYVPALELFHETILKTSMGQSLDILAEKGFKKGKIDKFTMDRYKAIVKFKTSIYSFQIPVTLAMYMSDIYDSERHRQATNILLQMGEYFQIQDDYIDCFGDPDVTGKAGRDIQEGKCTWLIVVALQRATPQQRKLLEECYGHEDADMVQTVKRLYKEIGLPSLFATYDEESYNHILDNIQLLSHGLPHEVFYKILQKIYKRKL